MPPRKRRVATPQDEIELAHMPQIEMPSNVPPLTATDERRAQELEDIIDEIGSESRVRVWQIVDGKSSFAGEMSGDGFNLDALLDAYGGGDKALAIYTGRVCVSRVRVSLDPTIPPKNPRQPKPIPGAAPPSGVPDMTTLLTGIAASQVQNASAMSQMMVGMVTAMTSLMAASRPTKDPIEIALEMAKAMKGGNGNESPSDFLAALKQGIDIGERISGGKDDDDGVMTAVTKGLDTLGEIVRGVVEDRRSARALPPAPPAPPYQSPVVDIPPTAQPSPSTEPMATDDSVRGAIRPWVAAARPYIGQLFAASRFMQPEAAASTIAHNLDDDQFFDLMDDIHDQTNGGFGVRLRDYFPREVEGVDVNWIGRIVEILITDYVDDTPESETPAETTEPPKPA